jgi:MacB-like protein
MPPARTRLPRATTDDMLFLSHQCYIHNTDPKNAARRLVRGAPRRPSSASSTPSCCVRPAGAAAAFGRASLRRGSGQEQPVGPSRPALRVLAIAVSILAQGRTPDGMRGNPDNPQIRAVSHDYLQTMGVRRIAGRWFDARDDAAAPPVIIVNRLVVQRLFGNQNPMGRLVHLDGRMEFAPQRIVGVVEDMRQARLDLEPAPQMFVDYREVLALTQARKLPTAVQERLAFAFLSFVVRTAGEPAELIPVVRSLVAGVDPSSGIEVMLPMEQIVASALTRQRVFAIIAVLASDIPAQRAATVDPMDAIRCESHVRRECRLPSESTPSPMPRPGRRLAGILLSPEAAGHLCGRCRLDIRRRNAHSSQLYIASYA